MFEVAILVATFWAGGAVALLLTSLSGIRRGALAEGVGTMIVASLVWPLPLIASVLRRRRKDQGAEPAERPGEEH